MNWQRGDQLSETNKLAVLNMFVHRMTTENIKARPEMARRARSNGNSIPVVLDAVWLAVHSFAVTKQGEISRRHKFCASSAMGELMNKEAVV